MNKHFFVIIAILGSLTISLYSMEERQAAVQELAHERDLCKKEISDHTEDVKRGKELLKHLYQGTGVFRPRPICGTTSRNFPHLTVADILATPDIHKINDLKKMATYMVWGLFGVAAEQKHSYFTEGTFVIDDPQLKLYTFLSNISDTYKRLSTHFNEFKANKYLDRHHGLDLEDLPCNKRHILFDKLIDDRIFVKPENFGLEKISDSIGHIKELIVAKARKVEVLRNLFNLTSDQDANFKKERISHDILSQYKAILSQIEPDKETVDLAVRLGKEYGLQKIIPTLKEYMLQYQPLRGALPQEPQPLDLSVSWYVITQKDYDQARDLLDKVVDFLEELATQDNLMQRTGNEIIITQADLRRALIGKTALPEEID